MSERKEPYVVPPNSYVTTLPDKSGSFSGNRCHCNGYYLTAQSEPLYP